VVVGVPTANRNRPELAGLIGFFVNTLVLRVDLSGSPTFADVLERVRTHALAAYANQDLPFEKLVEELAPVRDLSRNPLVQVIFQLFEAGATAEAAALQAGMTFPSRTSLFDLRVDLAPGPDGLVSRLEYDVDLFDRATMEALVRRYLRLLEQVAFDAGAAIDAYDLMDDHEPGGLDRFAGPVAAVPERWVHQLVADQAARTPAAVAVVDGARSVTFAELDAQSDRLARHLREIGVEPGSVVAVCLPRAAELVVALLGVLKAGAAYLPLEIDLPPGRIAFMIADARAEVVVTTAGRADAFAELRAVVDIGGEEFGGDGGGDDGAVAWPEVSGSDPAWVLYTSGSSGRPKGVIGTHVGLANRIAWGASAQPFDADDVACAKSRIGFVDAVCELFAPLVAGVPVVLVDDATAGDPAALADLIVAEGVTRLVAVPSLLRVLAEVAGDTLARSRLRLVNSSGEPLSATDVRALRRILPECELWNIYGSTEVAADATAHRVERLDAERVPIGRPLDNVTIELRDPSGALVPSGAVGEIVVGGVGVSPGYLGHAATENDRFSAGSYRTGDLGRWRPDGTLEHHGRADRQLKIRGIRVEPDELEHALMAHPHVAEAAAVARAGTDGPALAAYYTATHPTSPDELRAHLAADLPSHLIPTHLTELPSLPRLANGKLDRRTLAQLEPVKPASSAESSGEPPATPEERVVAEVFAQLTGAPDVSRDDDFFALGGHSLLATRAVSRIGQRLGTSIELRLIFEHGSVASLAAAIAALDRTEAAPALPIGRVDRERFRLG
jgi:amino acid adenylation domain-containing protein